MAKNTNEEVRFLHGGRDFFGLLGELIKNARQSIHLQTYIFNGDQTGTIVAELLKDAARRKVEVYLMVDGYASRNLPGQFIQGLKQSGVHFRFFEPLLKSKNFYFGRRLHHKVFVADESHAIVCGLNIADRYNDLAGSPAWFDAGVFVKGQVAAELAAICAHLWSKPANVFVNKARRRSNFEEAGVRIRRNDWVMGKHEISRGYREVIANAGESITILCSYFLPGLSFRKKLKAAVARGVKIRVLLAGESDVPIAKQAERYLYRWMLRHKMEIYEYQPTVLHAKMAIADEETMTIGSYNINGLSALATIELNLEVRNRSLVQQVQEEIDGIIETDCLPITPKQVRLLSLKNFMQFCCFYLLRIALKLSTFYFKQH